MLQSPRLLRPLSEFPLDDRSRIVAVLTDIDDTLTVEGRLPAVAYEALEILQESGLRIVPVTGRPAGWCDMIARFWPVDGVVGENGAFYYRYDGGSRRMIRRYHATPSELSANRERLKLIEDRVLREVPGCRIAADQAYREADLAVDFAEDVAHLSPSDIDAIVRIFEDAGAQAKVSSIHVNGWFGAYDKLGMARLLLGEEFGLDIDRPEDNARVVFVGDSPNDEPMFGFFRNSIGVANVTDFVDRMTMPPKWLTLLRGGYGFNQVAASLLEAR